MKPSRLHWIFLCSLLPGLMIFIFARSLYAADASSLLSIRTLQSAPTLESRIPWQDASPHAIGLTINKTVGTNANSCATTGSIEVEAGTRVTYCYAATNTGEETLVTHSVVDDKLGTLLNDFPYELAPSASVFLTQTAIINSSVTNNVTWTAKTAEGLETSTSDTATVTVVQPSLSIAKTVGTDPNHCASTDSIEVEVGTRVTYCYFITNTGSLPLVSHVLTDDRLGILLNDFPYALAPSASVFLTQTAIINNPVTNTAAWTSRTVGNSTAQDSDTATVITYKYLFLPLIQK